MATAIGASATRSGPKAFVVEEDICFLVYSVILCYVFKTGGSFKHTPYWLPKTCRNLLNSALVAIGLGIVGSLTTLCILRRSGLQTSHYKSGSGNINWRSPKYLFKRSSCPAQSWRLPKVIRRFHTLGTLTKRT